MYAIIIDGKVTKVSAETPPAGAMFMECGADVQPGWIVEGGVCIAPLPDPQPDLNAAIDARIIELEATQHRATRELLLTLDVNLPAEARARLQEVDAQIEALRARRV